ncbi:hypothetical protein MANES_02G057400v8 [Manihot esculenta]|uniref:Uncharacterized protein n=1 Tax=Manihot esculenta TaxID=3983 RepID=A0A2C9WCS2_MANES|nr:hypothetical protein MANES_02G057400v8 [Manihot esculenta]
MEKPEMRSEYWKIQKGLCLSLLVFIIASACIAEHLQGNTTDCFCNATIGEFHEEAFSDVRPTPPFATQLQMVPPRVTYDSFGKQQICKGKIYGDCLGASLIKGPPMRTCAPYTRCRVKDLLQL